jgi:hypothetical protein
MFPTLLLVYDYDQHCLQLKIALKMETAVFSETVLPIYQFLTFSILRTSIRIDLNDYNLYLTTDSIELSFCEKLTDVQILKNSQIFYRTRRFVVVFTRALHWFLS